MILIVITLINDMKFNVTQYNDSMTHARTTLSIMTLNITTLG